MSLDFEGAAQEVLDDIDDPVKRLNVARLFAKAKAQAEASRWHISLPDGRMLHTWILDHDETPPAVIHMRDDGMTTVYEVAEADLETRQLVLRLVQ